MFYFHPNESQGNLGPVMWTLKRHPRPRDIERLTQFLCLDCSGWLWIYYSFGLVQAYCGGRVDLVDWAGGDIDLGLLSRVGDETVRKDVEFAMLDR